MLRVILVLLCLAGVTAAQTLTRQQFAAVPGLSREAFSTLGEAPAAPVPPPPPGDGWQWDRQEARWWRPFVAPAPVYTTQPVYVPQPVYAPPPVFAPQPYYQPYQYPNNYCPNGNCPR